MYSGKSGCFRTNWLYSGKVAVLGQGGCIWEKIVVFGKKWLYSGKLVVFSEKVVVFVQKRLYLDKVNFILEKLLYSRKRGCNRAN